MSSRDDGSGGGPTTDPPGRRHVGTRERGGGGVTSNIGGFAGEPGASPALHRWLDVLRDAGPTGTARLAHPAGSGRAGSSDAAAAAAGGRSVSSAGAGARATDLGHLLRAHGAASRLAPAALGAHAAVGELDVRRAAFAAVERTLADSVRALRAPVQALEPLLQQATAAADGAGATGSTASGSTATGTPTNPSTSPSAGPSANPLSVASSGSPSRSEAQREVAARTAVTVREGAGALARAADRLDTLRLEAEADVRATAAQVDALSQEVASADRRARMEARAQDRLDSERAGAREAQTRRDEAEARRDTAARELVRLTGASVHVASAPTSAAASGTVSGAFAAGSAGASGTAAATGVPGSASSLSSSGSPSAEPESGASAALRIMLGDRALVDEHGAHPLVVRSVPGAPPGVSDPAAVADAPRDARGDRREAADPHTGAIDRRALQSAAARLAQADLEDGDPSARSSRERRISDREARERVEDRRSVRERWAALDDGDSERAAALQRASQGSTTETSTDRSRAASESRPDVEPASREASHRERAEGSDRLERSDQLDRSERREPRESSERRGSEDAARDAAGDADRLVRKALARIDAEHAAAAVADLRDGQRAADAADRAVQEAAEDAAREAADARTRAPRLQLSWADGADVEATAGVLAGRLAAAERIVPDAQERVQSAIRAYAQAVDALTLPGGALEGYDPADLLGTSAAAGRSAEAARTASGPDRTSTSTSEYRPGGSGREAVEGSTSGPVPLAAAATRASAGLTVAVRGVETARAEAGEQSVLAQRRLDVLSVVDSVLADAPSSQAGSLVSAALGGGAAPTGAWQTSQSGQHLVSSLQSLNAVTASLGAVAGLSAVVGPTAPTVTVSGSATLVATPSASALDGRLPGLSAGQAGALPVGMSPDLVAGIGRAGGAIGGGGALAGAAGLGVSPAGGAAAGPVGSGGGLSGAAEGSLGATLWTSGPGVRVALLAPATAGALAADPSLAGDGGPAGGSGAVGTSGTSGLGPAPVAPGATATGGAPAPTSGAVPGGGAPAAQIPRSPQGTGVAAVPGTAGSGSSIPSGTPSLAATGPGFADSSPTQVGTGTAAGSTGDPTFAPEAPGLGLPAGPTGAAGPSAEAAAWSGPHIPYDVEVSVVSVAAAAAVATAPLPTGAVLNSGRGFSFALVTHAGSPGEATTSVSVGPGARLGTVAAAINASAAPVFAQVEGVGAGSPPAEQRLLISATETGADTAIALVDGFGSRRPSALGGVAQVQAGADSVVQARFADGAVVGVSGATTSLPGALPGVDLALRAGSGGAAGIGAGGGTGSGTGTGPGAGAGISSGSGQGAGAGAGPTEVGATARVEVRADTPAALRQLTTLVDAASAVLDGLRGRGPIDPAAAGVLAQDPAIADLTTRIAAVLTGAAGASGSAAVSGTVSGAGASGAIGAVDALDPVGRRPLPGVHLDREARLQVDAEAFGLAHADDPYAVESQVHRAARELLAVAREASDPRTGVLPVRIVGESAFVQEYAVTQAGVDERMQYRQEALTDRVDAMQSLLDHLGAERQWLSTQV